MAGCGIDIDGGFDSERHGERAGRQSQLLVAARQHLPREIQRAFSTDLQRAALKCLPEGATGGEELLQQAAPRRAAQAPRPVGMQRGKATQDLRVRRVHVTRILIVAGRKARCEGTDVLRPAMIAIAELPHPHGNLQRVGGWFAKKEKLLPRSGPGIPDRLRQTLCAAARGWRRRGRAVNGCERYCSNVQARTACIATALSRIVRSTAGRLASGILNIDAVSCGTLLVEHAGNGNAGDDATGLHDADIEYATGIDQLLRGLVKVIAENRLQSLHREGSQADQCIVSAGGWTFQSGIVAGMEVRSPLRSREQIRA